MVGDGGAGAVGADLDPGAATRAGRSRSTGGGGQRRDPAGPRAGGPSAARRPACGGQPRQRRPGRPRLPRPRRGRGAAGLADGRAGCDGCPDAVARPAGAGQAARPGGGTPAAALAVPPARGRARRRRAPGRRGLCSIRWRGGSRRSRRSCAGPGRSSTPPARSRRFCGRCGRAPAGPSTCASGPGAEERARGWPTATSTRCARCSRPPPGRRSSVGHKRRRRSSRLSCSRRSLPTPWPTGASAGSRCAC